MKKSKRINFLRRKNSHISDVLFLELLTLDPTQKKIYSQWVLNLYNKKQLREEDFYKAKEYLVKFEETKHLLKEKDINRYKTLPEIIKSIKDLGGLGKTSEDETYLITDRYYINIGEAEVHHEDDKYLIVVPKTLKASQFYSSKTEWCTYYPDSFRYYTDKDDLYIIISKKLLNTDNYDRLLQFHFQSRSFYNILDEPISISRAKEYMMYFKSGWEIEISIKFNETCRLNSDTIAIGGFIGWGIATRKGIIIKPIYDFIKILNDELIGVVRNKKVGIFDIKGKEILPCKYLEIKILSHNLIAVKYDRFKQHRSKHDDAYPIGWFLSDVKSIADKWAIVDYNGNEIVPPSFNSIEPTQHNYLDVNIDGNQIKYYMEGFKYEHEYTLIDNLRYDFKYSMQEHLKLFDPNQFYP